MINKIKGNMPAGLKSKLKGDSKFKYCYDERSGHFLASMARYDRKAAALLAVEYGYRPDIERLEDISASWAAFRFNGNGPTGYTEVEAGTRGAFPVWAFPVLQME